MLARSRLVTRGIAQELAASRLLLAAAIVAMLSLISAALIVIPTPYDIELPGPVTDVQRTIEPNPKPVRGALYLTTIYTNPASAGAWLFAKVNPEAGIVPHESVRPKGIGERQYQVELVHMMDESKVVAQVVAFRAAGHDVGVTGQGAEVRSLSDASRAKGLLATGDVIVAADGNDVTTANDLIALIKTHRPGDVIPLRVHTAGSERQVDVPLIAATDEPESARIGIVVQTHVFQYKLPQELTIRTRDIGGPSAGLMLSLGVYNAITPGDVTAGHRIAGTGTISSDGTVGRVGGVRFKVIAAEKSGAELFLVPKDDYAEAKSAAHRMRVVAVQSFQDALTALQQLPAAG